MARSMAEPTASDVAHWMLLELERKNGRLDEGVARSRIARIFGRTFVAADTHDAPALNRSVLDAFEQLTAGTVVWSREERAWRYHDEGGRIA